MSRTDSGAPEVVAEDSLQLLTPAEAADLLKVSAHWMYSAAADGRLPYVRLSHPAGPVRFRRQELLDHLNNARSAWRPGPDDCHRHPLRRVL